MPQTGASQLSYQAKKTEQIDVRWSMMSYMKGLNESVNVLKIGKGSDYTFYTFLCHSKHSLLKTIGKFSGSCMELLEILPLTCWKNVKFGKS